MVDVSITAAGESLLAELLPQLHAREAEWFAWLGEEDRRALIRTLGEANARFLSLLSAESVAGSEAVGDGSSASEGSSKRP